MLTHSMTLRAVLALLATVMVGCATSPEGKLYQTGVVTKTSAETMYEAIYAGWKEGLVSDEDRLQARAAYQQAAMAQHEFLLASQQGLATDPHENQMMLATQALRRLVAKYQL
jgi:hypothetical protein